MTMPRWMGDRPSCIQMGRMTGVSIRIRQAISIRQPRHNIRMLSRIRMMILLLVMENRPVAIMVGMRR